MAQKKYTLGGQVVERKYPINPKEVEPEYQEIAARMNFDGSKYLPRVLKKAFTLEQARVALELYTPNEEIAATLGTSKETVESDPKKYQIEAIAKKLNLDKETVEKDITYMFELGFGFPTRRGWRFARNILQAKDSISSMKFDEQLGDEFYDLWEALMRLEVYPTYYIEGILKRTMVGPTFRIMPARKALEKSNIPYDEIIPEDNIEELLKSYSLLAVEPCPCKRWIRDRVCKSPLEVCLIFDRIAEHNLRRDAARIISVEEALAIHDMACEWGMACNPQANVAKPAMICHCHWCCCDEFAAAIMMNFPLQEQHAQSSYRAFVDPNKCTGCQTCLQWCQFGAIEMKWYPTAVREEKLQAWVNPDKCMGCGLCVLKCPSEARTLKQVTKGEQIPKVAGGGAGFVATADYRAGKHMDTGSVLTRPFFSVENKVWGSKSKETQSSP